METSATTHPEIGGHVYHPAHLPADLRSKLGMPDIPLPVHKDFVERIYTPQGVRLDLLLEHLGRFVDDHPAAAPMYEPLIARLTLLLAISAGSLGQPSYAEALLELGLRHAGNDIGLRANHAFALQMAGRHEQAVAEFRSLIEALPLPATVLLRVLAARSCGEFGDHEQARELLAPLAEVSKGDESFQRFLAGL